MSPRSATMIRILAGCLLLSVVYFTVPVRGEPNGLRYASRLALTALAGSAAIWLFAREIRLEMRREPFARLTPLLIALIGGVLLFALFDYVLAVHGSGEFDGLTTRVDALYFALATVATVGYGDVHASGQLARFAVSLQIIFNVVVLATGASLFSQRLGARVRRHSGRGPGEKPPDSRHDAGADPENRR